jgi:hypothetical protein
VTLEDSNWDDYRHDVSSHLSVIRERTNYCRNNPLLPADFKELSVAYMQMIWSHHLLITDLNKRLSALEKKLESLTVESS